MTTLVNRISFAWEYYHPTILAIFALFLTLGFGPSVIEYLNSNKYSVYEIYSSVFDISSVFTAFLFTFYTFVVTTERGFIAAVKKSRFYKLAVRYTLEALLLGAFLTIFTIPMKVIVPAPTTFDATLFGVALWVALAVWTAAAFVRSSYLFTMLVSQHE